MSPTGVLEEGSPGGAGEGGEGGGAGWGKNCTKVLTAVGSDSTEAFDVISHALTSLDDDVTSSVAADDASASDGKTMVVTTTILAGATVTVTDKAVGKCVRTSATNDGSSNESTVPASVNVATAAGTYAMPGSNGDGGFGGNEVVGGDDGGRCGNGGSGWGSNDGTCG